MLPSPSSLAIKDFIVRIRCQLLLLIPLLSTTSVKYLLLSSPQFLTFFKNQLILMSQPSVLHMNWLTRKRNTKILRTRWIKLLLNWLAIRRIPFYKNRLSRTNNSSESHIII
jgi:hypothetical protein